MIWTLISIGVLLIGIGGVVCYNLWGHWQSDWGFWGWLCILFGSVATILFVSVLSVVICNTDIDYQNALAEKQMIEYRIEMGEELVGNELLYTQVVEFNNELRHIKKWAKSPWTNWFYNQKIAEIDYIEIPMIHPTEKGGAE